MLSRNKLAISIISGMFTSLSTTKIVEAKFYTDFFYTPTNSVSSKAVDKYLDNNGVIPGVYYLTVKVNDRFVGRERIDIKEKKGTFLVCKPLSIFKNNVVDISSITEPQQLDCGQFDEDNGIYYKLDLDRREINYYVPTKLLQHKKKSLNDLVDESLISGGYLNYNANAIKNGNLTDAQLPVTAQFGGNVGLWSFYADVYNDDAFKDDFQISRAYVEHPIYSLNSSARIGQLMTRSQLLTSGYSFYGVSLFTDADMWEDSLHYQPIIDGYLVEPSTVKVYVNGGLSTMRYMSAGYYQIADLKFPPYATVTIEEEGRSGAKTVRSLRVPYNSSLLKSGYGEYQLDVGYSDDDINTWQNSGFFKMYYGYGIGSYTPYISYFQGRQSFNAQLGLDSYLSWIDSSINTEYSYSQYKINGKTYSGDAIGLSVNKQVFEGFNVAMSSLFYASGYYLPSLNNQQESIFNVVPTQNIRNENRLNLTLSPSVMMDSASTIIPSVNLSYSQYEYYDNLPTQSQLNIYASASYSPVNYGLNFSYSPKNNLFAVGLSISVSLDEAISGFKLNNINMNMATDNESNTTYSNSINGTIDDNYGYSIGYSGDNKENYEGSLAVSSKVNNVFNYNIMVDTNETYNAHVGGSIAYTNKSGMLISDLNLSNPVIAKVGNRSGIEVNGEGTNKDGYVLLNNPSGRYREGYYHINPSSVNTNILIPNYQQEIYSGSKSFAFVDFQAQTLKRVYMRLKVDGKFLPMGTILNDKKGENFVVDYNGGLLFSTNLEGNSANLDIVLKNDQYSCSVVVSEEKTDGILNLGSIECTHVV